MLWFDCRGVLLHPVGVVETVILSYSSIDLPELKRSTIRKLKHENRTAFQHFRVGQLCCEHSGRHGDRSDRSELVRSAALESWRLHFRHSHRKRSDPLRHRQVYVLHCDAMKDSPRVAIFRLTQHSLWDDNPHWLGGSRRPQHLALFSDLPSSCARVGLLGHDPIEEAPRFMTQHGTATRKRSGRCSMVRTHADSFGHETRSL